jgi:hypothetical protein
MSRYAREYGRPGSAGRDRQRGRYAGDFGGGDRQRAGRGYDRGFAASRQARPNELPNRYRSERGAAPWYPNPDRGLDEGFGDFSGRGRYGGYWGATDLRPMMAGYDAEMRRTQRRRR